MWAVGHDKRSARAPPPAHEAAQIERIVARHMHTDNPGFAERAARMVGNPKVEYPLAGALEAVAQRGIDLLPDALRRE